MFNRKKKILVLLGHPDPETMCGAFADIYEQAARGEGHEVQRINIGAVTFDPILHKGYKVIQELEPDLVTIQQNISWADHIVVLYPNWWYTMPALLKGLFDRIWLPGFAFRFNKETGKVERLLRKKTARVIITMNVKPFKAWWDVGDYTNEIRRGILGFAGIWPVRVLPLAVEKAPEADIEKFKRQVFQLGRKAK